MTVDASVSGVLATRLANPMDLAFRGNIGSIDSYMYAVNKMPMLSLDQEVDLGRKLRDHNDMAAAQMLTLSHLRLVVSISRGYLGYGLPHADLIQEGNIGLLKAVKRFDPEQGVRLVSYAMHWIKAEIHEYIVKNWRLVKIATTKQQRKLFFNLRQSRTRLDTMTADDVTELAERLNVKPQEVMEMEVRFAGGELPFDMPNEDDDGKTSPISYLGTLDYEPAKLFEARDDEDRKTIGMQKALDALDARSRKVIKERWLDCDEDVRPKTLHELAAELGVSSERVRQIEVAAMKKMKASMIECSPSE